MEHAMAPYTAVFHFCDEQLLEAFLAKIPRSQLLEYVRGSESLRNRHFPGFRLSSTVPTFRQILSAYRKEIVDHRNSKLANALCTDWIRQQPLLASTALESLGVHSADPADARSWIEAVQSQLKLPSYKDIVGKLVWKLAAQFPSEDILIFVSTISYGVDQQTLRELVVYELAKSATDPVKQRERMESDLQSANTKIKNLELLTVELECQMQSELTKAREVLDRFLLEDDALSTALARGEEAIQGFTRQVEEAKSSLLTSQHARDGRQKERQKVSKAITRQREELLRAQSGFETRLKEVKDSIQQESSRIAELTESLLEAEELILANQPREKEVALAKPGESQPAGYKQADMILEPATPVEAMSGQSPKHTSEAVGNNAVCYQGIQRTFRNAVVAFLRERLTRLFPEDHIQRMKKTFGEEWDKAARNAALSRDILGTRTTVRDEYDLLGTNHFYGLFERFYDKLFSPEAGQPPDLPRPVKTRLLGNLKAIKDGRDPLSHPVEQEISFEEAHFLLYAAQEVLKWLGCSAHAVELSTLAAQLRGEEDKSTLVLRRVPSEDSIYLDFVGRNTLLSELTDCFANPDNKRCLLAGDGGKGKSAAAYRFVQFIPSLAGRFQLVVWLSAKTRKFRDRSVTTVDSPDFSTAGEAIDRLLTEYGATAYDMEKSLPDKKHLLFEYLNEFPAFIVADDVDTVLEDDEVVSLFTHEIPHTRSCVLITSRRAIPGIRTFIVPGFDPPEAEEFVKSRIRLYELNTDLFTSAVIKEIAHTTDGSPLYMDDLMRLAKIVDVKKAIKMWAEKGGDEARKYALQREIEKLSQDARKILIAAAVTDDPISFAELENVLELSEDRLLAGLTELQTLFLFPKAPAVEGEQRYQINLNTKKLVRLVEGPSEFYARIDNRSKALAGKLPAVGHSIVASLIKQALLRFNANQPEAETILLGAIEKYPNVPDIHGVLGYLYKRMGRVADARAQFEAAFKLKAKNPEMYLHWLRLETAEKEWSKALAITDRALKILPDNYEMIEGRVYVLRQAGFDLYRGTHYEKATKMWTEAVEEVRRRIKSPDAIPTGARHLSASMYYSIVVCLDMLNQLRERNYWLERWEKEHPDDPQVAVQKEFLQRKRGTLKVAEPHGVVSSPDA
jgi:tetratricopeptide (TPR) repeat protein